jgi:hypothetical protein
MRGILKKLSLVLSDYQVAYLMFVAKLGYLPDFRNPRSLNEKINYIKLFNRNPVRSLIADRLKVRDYVAERWPACSFPDILWHGTRFDRAAWEALPGAFVIKANHGSKMTKMVDKRRVDFDEIKKETDSWLRRDYSRYGREWVYDSLEKYLIVEEMLSHVGSAPADFKFFVLNGRVGFVQVDLERFSAHRRNLYTRDFIRIDAEYEYPNTDDIPKPDTFERAVEIAEELSVDFDFIRVDLYLIDETIYFGELTNTPENGFGRIRPRSFDFETGARLPDRIER